MSINQTFVSNLLRTYHQEAIACEETFHLPGIWQIDYLCDVGLGPIAFRAYGELLRHSSPELYSILLSADLTTRVIYEQMANSTIELLANLQSVGVTPILLKGISTANEFYSPSHLRLMGDVDILVKPEETEETMRTLETLGYETAKEQWLKYYSKGHHHLPAAGNPKTGVTIEVHTGLSASDGPFAQDPLFDLDSLERHRIDFEYSGIRAARFTPEFQLAYTIAHWAADGNWAMNLTSINDTIHILRKHESELDWSILEHCIATSPSLYPNLTALTSYLQDANIINNSRCLRKMRENSKVSLQSGTSKLLTSLLHYYPFNAREKNRDGYAIWRAHAIWQELTRPNSNDFRIPYSFLRVALKSIHHGKYNPLGWLLSYYRHLKSQLRSG